MVTNGNVHSLRKFHLRRVALQKRYSIAEPVGAADSPSQLNHAPYFNRINALGSGTAGKQTQDAGSRSEIKDNIAWPDNLAYGFAKGGHSQVVR